MSTTYTNQDAVGEGTERQNLDYKQQLDKAAVEARKPPGSDKPKTNQVHPIVEKGEQHFLDR